MPAWVYPSLPVSMEKDIKYIFGLQLFSLSFINKYHFIYFGSCIFCHSSYSDFQIIYSINPFVKKNHDKRARHIILPNVIFHVQVPSEDRLSIGGKKRSTASGYGDSTHYDPQIINRFSA